MDTWQKFLVAMAAISTASQTLTEHVVKKRLIAQLDMQQADLVQEARRQSLIHLITAVFGSLLALSLGLHPIANLAPESFAANQPVLEYLLVGVLVSYGGSFFNEALDLLRQFKLVQEEVRKSVVPPPPPEVPNLEVPPPANAPEDLEVRVIGTEGFDTRSAE